MSRAMRANACAACTSLDVSVVGVVGVSVRAALSNNLSVIHWQNQYEKSKLKTRLSKR